MKAKLILLMYVFFCLNGCSSSIPEADLDVVDAEKNHLAEQWNAHPQISREYFFKMIKPEYGHIQPENKTIECKIPIIKHPDSKDSEHKMYWDGNCINGYAVGLGRIIAKSTYDHKELIINLPDKGNIPSDYLYWFRDYVNNLTEYGLDYGVGETKGARNRIFKSPFKVGNELFTSITTGQYSIISVTDADQGEYINVVYQNPIYGYKKTIKEDPTVSYAYILAASRSDDENHQLGVLGVMYKNGQFVTMLPQTGVLVRVPSNYFDSMNKTFNTVESYAKQADGYAQKAKNMYETYIYRACNTKNSTDGIDPDLYHQICSYELQFRDNIAQLVQKIESDKKNRLAQINQQRLILAREQEAAAAMMRAQAAQEQVNAIDQLNSNLNRPRQTMCTNFGFGLVNCTSY